MPLIVATLEDQLKETPFGSGPLIVAPVAPVVAYVIVVKGVLMHRVWAFVPAVELSEMVFEALTERTTVELVVVPQLVVTK